MPDVMNCPKCGRSVEVGAFICPGCEYILDTSFLGEDITDDERDRRNTAAPPSATPGKTVDKPVHFGEDAIILGNGQGEYSDFSSKDAGLAREPTHARFYIGGNTAVILNVDSVPEPVPGVLEGNLKMSPFERHVLGFINGKRSIGRIHKKSAMEDSEFKTAVAMLADKGIIRLRTTKKKKKNVEGEAGSSLSSEVSRVAAAPASARLAADRTVVALVEEVSAERSLAAAAAKLNVLAAAALEDAIPTRAQVRGSRTSPAEPTIIKSEAKNSNAGPRFASVRMREDPSAPPVGDADALAHDWGEGESNNISSIFARARAGPDPVTGVKARTPSLADSIVNDDAEAARHHDQPTDEREGAARTTKPQSSDTGEQPYSIDDDDIVGLPEALRDPTGLGDARPLQMRAGDPLSDTASLEERATNHRDTPDVNLAETALRFRARPIDLRPGNNRTADIAAQPYSDDAPTGPLPVSPQDDEIDADDDDHVFEADDTASLWAKEGVEVSDIPATPTAAPVPALPQMPRSAPPILPLPGQALAQASAPDQGHRPPGAPPAMGARAPTDEQGGPPVAHPRDAVGAAVARSPETRADGMAVQNQHGPMPATRASAGSTVPFEQRRKAEKIFEQALKDHAAGRISSARMNAKLAMMYDSSVPAYRAFLAELDVVGPKVLAPGASKPKELTLFEQASDAESRGDFKTAVVLLEEAVSINPKAAALRNRLGVVMSIRLKRHTEALEHLRMAIELEPGNIVYMNNFSKVTAVLESQIEKEPERKKGKKGAPEKVHIKTMRPKTF